MTDTTAPRFAAQVPDSRPEPRTEFDHALRDLLDDLFAAQPAWATQIGFHAFDDRWPDMTQDGRTGRLEMLRRHRRRLQELPDDRLSDGEQIDRGIVTEAIDALEFGDGELRDAAWDPLSYVQLCGTGFFTLLAREFGPWEQRAEAFLGRMRALPDLLDAAARGLTGLPGRPVSLLHTQTAMDRLSGIGDLIDQAVAEGERQTGQGAASGLADALSYEAVRAKQATEEFGRRLREDVAPRAEGEGRLGGELFARKLRHTLSSDRSVDDLQARAKHDYEGVRTEMLSLAQEAWPEWVPGTPLPTGEGADAPEKATADEVIGKVLDAIAREHRQPVELLDWCRAEVRRLEDFCRRHGIVELPDAPLQLTWTPVFMRAYGGAFLDPPGPLDKGLPSYFWVTPPDEAAGPAAVESYLREENDRMLRLLCMHEGVPGHYLQLWWSNRTPNLARSVFASGMFAEGWAVYVTQVMMDAGYGDHEPALLLSNWKFYLRAIVNTLIDVGIHTAGMTQEEAIGLMVDGGFQEAHEAKAKYLRARLTSTQLSTYFLGSIDMWDLDVEARRRAAARAGAGPEAVPDQRIAGGLGDTPGFDQRAHLEAVLSHGTPPTKWIRQILFGG